MTNTTTSTDIRPFRVEVDQAELDDLMERLARTRLPQPAPVDDWDHGTPTSYLRDAVEQWRTQSPAPFTPRGPAPSRSTSSTCARRTRARRRSSSRTPTPGHPSTTST